MYILPPLFPGFQFLISFKEDQYCTRNLKVNFFIRFVILFNIIYMEVKVFRKGPYKTEDVVDRLFHLKLTSLLVHDNTKSQVLVHLISEKTLLVRKTRVLLIFSTTYEVFLDFNLNKNYPNTFTFETITLRTLVLYNKFSY